MMLFDLILPTNVPESDPSVVARAMPEGIDRAEAGPVWPKGSQLGSLVLTRHVAESIMIGDEVEAQVVGIRAGTVRIKVLAPRSIPVHRREVFEAIREGSGPVRPGRVDPQNSPRPGPPSGGLVLARSTGQSIIIGEDVELIVVEVRATTVKLKVTAPRSIAVHRREVFEAIREGGLG